MNKTGLLLIGICLQVGSLFAAEAQFFNDFKIPMRDGVNLAADIYLPTNRAAKVGCHLVFTPYGGTTSTRPPNASLAESWGVVTMSCDCRGLCHSEGKFDAWDPQLTDDAYDLLDWISKQPWSNGKVVMVGGSYPGFTTLAAVRSGHPALVGCSTSVVTLDPYPINFQNGVLIPFFYQGWHSGLAGRAKWEEMARHRWPADPYWKARADLRDIAKSRARVYYQAGWYDMLGVDAFGTFNDLPKGSVMRMGPWNHGVNEFNSGGPDYSKLGGVVDDAPETELFKALLEGRPSEIDKNPGRIHLYVQGRNEWRWENEWPLKRQVVTRHVFAQEAKKFRHDPKNPVPMNGGRLIGGGETSKSGQSDQRKTEAREDVLSFDGEILANDLEVTGDVKAELVLSSTATNSDVYVKLVDVLPDGTALHVIEAACRSDFTPGKPKTVAFFMDITSYVFLKGHRIRVDVYGSCVPHYELNPIPAEITVHKGSALLLPVIPEK